jgi:hypothetical protein
MGTTNKGTPPVYGATSQEKTFVLVVDDFGIQIQGKQDAQHLIATLKEQYEIMVDWDGKLFCGITLDWDYKNGTVDLSMPNYVHDALLEFQHEAPSKPEHQPYRHNPPQFGAKIQMMEPADTSKPLDKDGILRLQQITGKFLYYSRAVDPTMNAALSSLASQQAKGTEQTARDATKFLNYCATHPDAKLRYYASDMVLKVHSDASYLSESNAAAPPAITTWAIRKTTTTLTMELSSLQHKS